MLIIPSQRKFFNAPGHILQPAQAEGKGRSRFSFFQEAPHQQPAMPDGQRNAPQNSPCRGTATARFLRNASAPKTAFIAQHPARTAPVARLSSRNAAKRPSAFQKQERPCRNWQGLWLPYQNLIQSGEMSRRGKNGARFYPRTPKGEKWGTGGILEDSKSYPLRPSICLDTFWSKKFTQSLGRFLLPGSTSL